MCGHRWLNMGLIALLAAGFTTLAMPGAEQQAGVEWKLVWSDEFDGKQIDKTKWDFDLGNGFYAADGTTWVAGWGNNELEYYTKEADNAFVKDGMLHIQVLKKPTMGFNYTSARLKTKKADGSPLFNMKYGKVEFRAKLPTGRGIWPLRQCVVPGRDLAHRGHHRQRLEIRPAFFNFADCHFHLG